MTDTPECQSMAALREPPPEIDATLAVLGGKWKILILWQLIGRPCRFNELRRAITGVSQHMLTTHLRELEGQGIVSRKIFAEVPPRVEYSLTDHGKTLGTVLRALAEWGKTHLERSPAGQKP